MIGYLKRYVFKKIYYIAKKMKNFALYIICIQLQTCNYLITKCNQVHHAMHQAKHIGTHKSFHLAAASHGLEYIINRLIVYDDD